MLELIEIEEAVEKILDYYSRQIQNIKDFYEPVLKEDEKDGYEVLIKKYAIEETNEILKVIDKLTLVHRQIKNFLEEI